jgi:hypothetical protein
VSHSSLQPVLASPPFASMRTLSPEWAAPRLVNDDWRAVSNRVRQDRRLQVKAWCRRLASDLRFVLGACGAGTVTRCAW